MYVAKALGVPEANITWKQADGDERQRLLTSGEADLIVATFSITDERKKVVDFAGPYFEAHQDLLVRRNDTEITEPGNVERQERCARCPARRRRPTSRAKYLGRIQLIELPTSPTASRRWPPARSTR